MTPDSPVASCVAWAPLPRDPGVDGNAPMELGTPPGGEGRSRQLFFIDDAPPRWRWDRFRGYAAEIDASGMARVVLAAPFILTIVGTDPYTDQFWEPEVTAQRRKGGPLGSLHDLRHTRAALALKSGFIQTSSRNALATQPSTSLSTPTPTSQRECSERPQKRSPRSSTARCDQSVTTLARTNNSGARLPRNLSFLDGVGGASLTLSTRGPWRAELVAV